MLSQAAAALIVILLLLFLLLSAFSVVIPVTAFHTAEFGVRCFCDKGLAALPTLHLKILSDDMLARFYFLVKLSFVDALFPELFLPLDLFLAQLRLWDFKLSDEIQIDVNVLHTLPVNIVRSVARKRLALTVSSS